MTCDLSVIIACYNEQGHLEQSVREIVETLEVVRYTWELIFIDDCSTDGTREIIERITAGQPNMKYVFHRRNVGRGGTVQEGFQLAEGRVVGFLDIDLEVHCRYIPSMVQAIDSGYDAATAFRVYKVRFAPMPLVRHVLSRGYRLLSRRSLRVPLKDTETGYKFFARQAILPILEETEHKGWFWDTEIMALAWLHGLKINEIPCLFVQRSDKKSTVRIFRDVYGYLMALRGFRRHLRGRESGRDRAA